MRTAGRPARAAVVAVVGVLAAMGALLAIQPAQAATCVTVVVQGQGKNCVAAGGSGIAVMDRAGFTANTSTPGSPGFVCQINSTPATCTPPNGNAYWAYWHATPGTAWTYSNVGAGSYTPVAGNCEGWRFERGGAMTPPRAPCPRR